MKNCLIVYDSYHHGNTEKIAHAMAGASGSEICSVEKANGEDVGGYEIIGLGSGIAYGKHYERLLKAVRQYPLKGKRVFVFSTSGTGSVKYNAALIHLLQESGASVIGEFSCRGYDTFGPFKLVGGIAKGHPDDEDIANAKEFIGRMLA